MALFRILCVKLFSVKSFSSTASYLFHPEIFIEKPIQSSQNLHIHPIFNPDEFQKVSYFDPDKNCAKSEPPTLDPERYFIDPEKNCWCSG